MSNTRTCAHIKVTGVRCGSPALRNEQYCYFHYRLLCSSRISHVALLEDEEAIQVSLMQVVNSLLCGTIDLKRGELVLRALNTAVRNARRARFESRSDMVRELPKDPVVAPRPRQYSKEELVALEKEMLAMIDQLGVNNIIIEAREANDPNELQAVRAISPGLTFRDYRAIAENIPGIEAISPRKRFKLQKALPKTNQELPQVIGVLPNYKDINSLKLVSEDEIEWDLRLDAQEG